MILWLEVCWIPCIGSYRILMLRTLALSLAFLLLPALGAQEPAKPAGSLTLDEVVKFAKSGLPEELLIERVKGNAKPFDLNSDEILELKRSGVSDNVIKYLLNPSLAYVPAPPSNPASASAPPLAPPVKPKPPKDPLALKVPPEPGIYYLGGKDEFPKLDLRPVVPFKQPGKVLPLISAGLLKGHVVGSVAGPGARTRTSGRPLVFYARLGDKGMPDDDLVLVNFDPSENRRDIDMGTKSGKQAFPVKSVRQFESEEVMPGLFRLNVTLEKPGEYFFFLLGSADEKKGLLGRGYDFGLDLRVRE